jgi:hypothetical protein
VLFITVTCCGDKSSIVMTCVRLIGRRIRVERLPNLATSANSRVWYPGS